MPTSNSRYPKGLFPAHSVHDVMLDGRFRVLQKEFSGLKITLTFARNLDVNGFPGREYKAVNESGDRVGRLQIYSTPKRSISFLAFDSVGEAAERRFATFFNSIQIDTTEPKAP